MTSRIDDLTGQVEALAARIEQLEAENASLRGATTPVAELERDGLSRRHVLRRSAGVVAAGVGLAAAGNLLGARGARAAAGDELVIGQVNSAGSSSTQLLSTNGNQTVRLFNTGMGKALQANANSNPAIMAISSGSGITSLVGQKDSTGAAIGARINHTTSTYGAIESSTAGTGPGILATSAKGRGGEFNGQKAQIRLRPSAASTHPSSGAAGDLFLDSSLRLWLCKGGSSWVKII